MSKVQEIMVGVDRMTMNLASPQEKENLFKSRKIDFEHIKYSFTQLQ